MQKNRHKITQKDDRFAIMVNYLIWFAVFLIFYFVE